MIRFVDSASWCTQFALSTGAGLKYNMALSANLSPFLQPGRSSGYAYYFFDVEWAGYIALDQQTHWRDSRSLLVGPGNAAFGQDTNIWVWMQGLTPIACLQLGTDGKIRIFSGGATVYTQGALLYTSQATLSPSTWYSIDLDWSFPLSGLGSCALYINDVLDTGNPGMPSVIGATWDGTPDTFAMVGVNSGAPGAGYVVCDIVVSDGSGSANNSRLGPCQVKAYFPGANALVQWPTVIPATDAAWQAVSEQPIATAPDGNTSYIGGATPGQYALFGFPTVDCYAGILGVAWNVCARDPSAQPLEMIVRPTPSNGMDVALGSVQLENAYTVKQVISQSNAGATWVDGAIENAWWGVQAGVGAPVVTQLVLEKVTTRRNLPYQCGQLGSYCY